MGAVGKETDWAVAVFSVLAYECSVLIRVQPGLEGVMAVGTVEAQGAFLTLQDQKQYNSKAQR